ncbi:uncharacterized protein CC84DRAFT_1209134 [Paraphaeosphaeria sporulosa]|uniref:Secreted protein n=1 Tax=Paraphaeosphaeria sporulosa TaxID=1460663 RepID=A0A177C0P9_9PLEO|nr:uncharacterized protein CC84DRAFT_1209134 [Paraphaeosphaeria sporulosa]OAG01065.1 hypothetical protein CC84DRAFT_1209134 [Paraphaeosphaeria sporulosa]
MKLLCLLLLLFAAATLAIDIRFGGTKDCKGVVASCLNQAPNRCCYLPNGRQSSHISFGAVPGDWKITMRGHVGSNCDLAITAGGDSFGSGGNLQDYCYFGGSPAFIASGDYFFRSEKVDSSTNSPTDGSLVNGLILEDGTEYPLDGLDEDAIAEAVDAAFNGTIGSAIRKFKLSPLPA